MRTAKDRQRKAPARNNAPRRGRQKKNTRNAQRKLFVSLAVLGLFSILAGWLIDVNGLGALQAQSAENLSAVRISEVQNNNALTLPDAGGYAWIELENTGETPLSLRGLCLTRDSKLTKTLVFPDIMLDAGGFILVYADGAASPGSGPVLHAPFRLPRSGAHELFLYDAAQQLLDDVAVPNMQADESCCRDAQGEWRVTAAPTPGRANSLSQSREENVQPGDVALNEVVSSNATLFFDENGAAQDYVELINLSDHAVNLEGYRLSDSAAKPDKWRFPAITLEAGDTLAVHCSGENRRDDPGHLHAGFKLSGGETVLLSRPDGATISRVALPALRTGQALSRTGEGEWTTELPPTPNRENTVDAALELDGANRALRAGGVLISEVLAVPGNDDAGDWLELYNDSDAEVDLGGWSLSNRLNHPHKWQFPAGTTIAARGYLSVLLTADGTAAAGSLSAPFQLSGEGSSAISLCDAAGNFRDCLYIPQQYPGVSFGRSPGGDCGYFTRPTPMAENAAQALRSPAASAGYSVAGGLHTAGERFEVALSAPYGARVYYTLDCSDPDEGKTLYDGTPIAIDGTTILRTRVYEEGRLPSVMDTQSYLFDVNAASDAPYVVSLVSDPEGLYSDETGIMAMGPNAEPDFPYGDYGKGANFWMEWEREAHVELFTGDGRTALSQECGIKLHGRNTRAYELKSFKVMARGRYGAKRFRYPIFSDRPYDEYEAFILRYSGQDYKYTFMRDVMMSGLAANTSVMYMEAMECIVYLNGSYYSAMYIRENISPFSLARREGWTGQEDMLDLVKSGYEVKQGSNESYIALKAYLDNNDNNTQEAYDRIVSEVDIDNFIEYATLYIVFCPPDTVNVKRYRNPAADGRWRWVLYDVDRGLRDSEGESNGFKLMAQGTNAQLFKAVMLNEALRNRFLDNLNTALSTYLSSENMLSAAQAQYGRIKPLLPDYLTKVGVSQSKYQSNLKKLVSVIAKRPEQVLRQCAEALHMRQDEMNARFADAYAAIEAFNAKPAQ